MDIHKGKKITLFNFHVKVSFFSLFVYNWVFFLLGVCIYSHTFYFLKN